MATDQSPTTIYYDTLRNIPVPIQALCEAGLSPTQWTMLFILHFRKELQPEFLAVFNCEKRALLWTQEEIEDLYQRRYLRRNKELIEGLSESDAHNIHTTTRFTDLLGTLKEAWLPDGHYELARPAVHRNHPARRPLEPAATAIAPALADLDAFDELFQAYPAHILVQGELVSGRSSDFDTMAAAYAKALSGKHALPHADILELVKWGRENSRITMGLQKFIGSREWLGLQELRDQGYSGATFDSQTAI